MNNAGLRVKNLFNEKGQATLIVVLSLLGTVSVLVMTVGALSYNEIKKLNNIVRSSQSYYVAEAGIEDAVLRIKNHLATTSPYNLSVGEGSTQVNINGPLAALVITSAGNVQNRVRKLEVDLNGTTRSNKVSFNYGVHVGYGGLVMLNNSTINGNVYSNGGIVGGSNNSVITGSAFAATGGGSVDQDNSTPITPGNSIIFANNSSAEDAAQSFQVSTSDQVKSVALYIEKVRSPGNLTVRITNNSSGKPGTTIYATGTLNASNVSTTYGWVTVNFSSNPQLTSGITYWLVLDGSSNSSNYYVWAANASYAAGEAKTGQYSGGPWSATSGLDGYFKLSIGGIQNSIKNVTVGSNGSGDARAYEVATSTIVGNNYCKIGSGNNKPCDTSQAVPPPQSFPLSDTNISDFKDQAKVGGTINGDYTPSGTSSTIGPKEITGNLTIPINHTFTLTGTVWVHGSILISGGAILNLSPSYGADGGVLIADGYIDLGNNVQFFGSGQSTSYFMLITTNDCDGNTSISPSGLSCTGSNAALDLSNNAGLVILYANRGEIHLKNNASTGQVTGYKLAIDQNTSINYVTGLADSNFSSGPGGGFQITSWKEIE